MTTLNEELYEALLDSKLSTAEREVTQYIRTLIPIEIPFPIGLKNYAKAARQVLLQEDKIRDIELFPILEIAQYPQEKAYLNDKIWAVLGGINDVPYSLEESRQLSLIKRCKDLDRITVKERRLTLFEYLVRIIKERKL